MSGWHGGKGSTPRAVNRQKFADNWDAIFAKKKPVDETTETTDNQSSLGETKDTNSQ
jgi:hypothetical protein